MRASESFSVEFDIRGLSIFFSSIPIFSFLRFLYAWPVDSRWFFFVLLDESEEGLFARRRKFLPQPVAVGNVQSLRCLEGVEEFFGSSRVMAIPLELGDDHALSLDVILAFGNMPLGEGEMFCDGLSVHNLASRIAERAFHCSLSLSKESTVSAHALIACVAKPFSPLRRIYQC